MTATGKVTVLISFNGMYAGEVVEAAELDSTVEAWAKAGYVRIERGTGAKSSTRSRTTRQSDSGGGTSGAARPGTASPEQGEDPSAG